MVRRCVLGGPPMRPATDTCHGSIAGEGSFAGPGSLDPKTLPPPDDTRTPPTSAAPERPCSDHGGYLVRSVGVLPARRAAVQSVAADEAAAGPNPRRPAGRTRLHQPRTTRRQETNALGFPQPSRQEERLLTNSWGSGGGAGSTHPPEKGYDSYISTVQPDILSLDTYPTFGNPHDPAAALCPL